MVSEKATVEVNQLRDYELIVVISPEIADDKLEAAVTSISKFVTDKGGTVSEVARWGKRRLAYPIKHFVEGNYILTRFSIKPPYSRELEGNLRISEDVIRFLLVKGSGVKKEGIITPKSD